MPNHILNLISINLNKNHKSLNGSSILILGVSYKKDINDTRESPAIDIIQLLLNAQAIVDYYDPHVPNFNLDSTIYKSIAKIDKKILINYDACVIVTDHSNIDYELIHKNCRLIIDTRNVLEGKDGNHIKRLGQGFR